MSKVPANTARKQYAVLLISDFTEELTSRILDVYRFFRTPPRIILARRGKRMRIDARISTVQENVPVPLARLENLRLTNLPAIALSVSSYLLYSLVLYYKLMRTRARLVHAHFIFPQGLFGLIIARLLRIPFCVTATGTDVNVVMTLNPLLRAVCRVVLAHADTSICVSKPLQDRLRKFGVSNTLYLPNSVDISAIKQVVPSAKGDSILYVGSMTENKRPLAVLRSFEKVVSQIPTATLVMCGDGPLRTIVEDEISKRGVRVRLIPKISPEDLNELRANTALFVLPSRHEGLSLALLEAMGAGQTIIASRNESHISLLTDGQNALLVDPDNTEDFTGKIILAIQDKELRSRLSESARHLCESVYSNAMVAGRLEEVYLKVIAKSEAKRQGTTTIYAS
jgi:glycosyltransferase involved in cell wall biosynthesis